MLHLKRPMMGISLALSTAMAVAPIAAPAQAKPVFEELADLAAQVPTPTEDQVPQVGPEAAALSSELGTTGFRLTKPFHHEPGPIRQAYGHRGPHPTAATAVASSNCTPFYQFYNQVLRLSHGVSSPGPCYGIAPEGKAPAVGHQFFYPTDLAAGERAPLIVLSPGIGVEPGTMHRHAEFYASHGYIVAMGYSWLNWFGAQMAGAAAALHIADLNPNDPLYQHVDFSRMMLVGHSAGGGSALRMSGLMDGFMHSIGRTDARVIGVAGINPGPADFALASPPSAVPSLVMVAEHETLVTHPQSRIAYDRATGSKWWAMLKDAAHGAYLDTPETTPYDATIVAMADWLAKGDTKAAGVFQGDQYLLAQDPEFGRVERG